ncbi:hypothetical protein [Marinospirillum perlucidum]|uniref:hypothetical protein n=1 Tax=Marinospirillum perlucidum TaxID=1982602 RepID=UPI000DF147D4|nr:hypothetical protein [Marinospirillum perlucidum]
MFKQLILATLLILIGLSEVHSKPYTLPLPAEAVDYEMLEEKLGDRGLVSELINHDNFISETAALDLYESWQIAPSTTTQADQYTRLRQERLELNRALAELATHVEPEVSGGVDGVIAAIHQSLQKQNAQFYLPVYLVSITKLSFAEDELRSRAVQIHRAQFATKHFGLEQILSQQSLTNGHLSSDVTQLSTVGRLELANTLASCQVRNANQGTTTSVEITRHRFYPFDSDERSHVTRNYVDNKVDFPDVEVVNLTQPLEALDPALYTDACEPVLSLLTGTNNLEDFSEGRVRLQHLVEEITAESSRLIRLARQVYSSEYGENCATLGCISNALNVPVEAADDWPKYLVVNTQARHDRIQAALHLALSFYLPEETLTYLQTVRTSVDEQVTATNYTVNNTQQLELARIADIQLQPYLGEGDTVGVIARLTLIEPSSELPSTSVIVDGHELVFREVYLNDEPAWILENNVSRALLDQFLSDNTQHIRSMLPSSCSPHSRFATCLNADGLEWFVHWLNTKTGQQISLPECAAWEDFLLEKTSTQECSATEGNIQGLCGGVRDACASEFYGIRSIGDCDGCDPRQGTSDSQRYYPHVQNGIRLQLK